MDERLETAAQASFADHLLRYGPRFGAEFERLCARSPELAGSLRQLAKEWTGEPAAPRSTPREIAGFEIVAELGRGGMGIVYEAIQREPRRRVALKVVRGDWLDDDRSKRIELEGRVLALLHHPAIVPLYGAGRTEDGSPWFAMERVEGRTLDLALGEDAPSLPARLALFQQICDAIAYAHRKGVVHRDLKPSNILLTDSTSALNARDSVGQVKILDFGLARITDADLSLVSMPADAGRIVGTLAYMAPEQLRGQSDDIDQRSDIYALGVLLYEMLTGARPFDLAGRWIGEAIERVDHQTPPRPSQHNPALRGDLDVIIQKAMARDPRRRYQSVSSLAEDVDRHVSGLPILAVPPSAAYQLRKLIARHRAGAAAVATVAAALLLLLAGFLWHQHRIAAAERANASAIRHERDIAAAVVRLQSEMLASVDPGRDGRDVRVIDVLAKAADEIDDGAYADQPEVEAALRHTIGVSYQGLGLYHESRPHLERSLALLRAKLGDGHAETLLAMTTLANLETSLDRLGEAEALYRLALDRYRESQGDDAPPTLVVRSNLGRLLQKRGRLDEALAVLEAVLADRRRVLGPDDPLIAFSAIHLGNVLRALGRLDEAARLFEEALELRRSHHGDAHPLTLTARFNLGLAEQDQGRLEDARRTLNAALDGRRSALGEDHPDTWTAVDALAAVERQLGNLAAALDLSDEVMQRKAELLGPEHSETWAARGNHAVLLRLAGRLDEAESLTRDVFAARASMLGEEHPSTRQTMSNLAVILAESQQTEEAERLTRRLIREPSDADRDDLVQHPLGSDVAARNTLAQVLCQRRQFAEAELLFLDLRRRMLASGDARHPSCLLIANNLGTVLQRSCRSEEAATLLQETLEIAEEDLPGAWITGVLRTNLGLSLIKTGAHAAAEDELLLGHEILARTLGRDHPNTRIAEDAIARFLDLFGQDPAVVGWRRLPDADQAD